MPLCRTCGAPGLAKEYAEDQFLVGGDVHDLALPGDEGDGDFQVGLQLVEDVDVPLQGLPLEQLVELG